MSNNDTLKVRMSNLEKNQDKIQQKLDKLPTKKEMELENRKLLEETFEKADKRYATKGEILREEEADKKYSSKNVEKIVYGLVVLLAFIVVAMMVAKSLNLPVDSLL